jgi:hypothetical protein
MTTRLPNPLRLTRSAISKAARHQRGICLSCPSRVYKGRWFCWRCRRFRAQQARWRAEDRAA